MVISHPCRWEMRIPPLVSKTSNSSKCTCLCTLFKLMLIYAVVYRRCYLGTGVHSKAGELGTKKSTEEVGWRHPSTEAENTWLYKSFIPYIFPKTFLCNFLMEIKLNSGKKKAHVTSMLQASLALSFIGNKRACLAFSSWFALSQSYIKLSKASFILSQDVACRVQEWRNIRKLVRSFWDHHLTLGRVLLSANLPCEAS